MNAGDEKARRLDRKEMEEDDRTDIGAKPRRRMEDAASTWEPESIVSTNGTEESIIIRRLVRISSMDDDIKNVCESGSRHFPLPLPSSTPSPPHDLYCAYDGASLERGVFI